jgi:sec-independent protein translocase protein TatA
MGSLSFVHWLIVIIVVFVLFGSGRLPGMVKGLGDGIREFKKGISDDPNGNKPVAKPGETPSVDEHPSDRKPQA